MIVPKVFWHTSPCRIGRWHRSRTSSRLTTPSNSEEQTAVCTFHTAVWGHVSAELKVLTTDLHCIQTVAIAVGVYAGKHT